MCGSFMLIYFLILTLGKIENVVVNKPIRMSACVDTFKTCFGWSRLGYCSSNSKERFMREYCKMSCNLCASTDPEYTSTSCRGHILCLVLFFGVVVSYMTVLQVVEYMSYIFLQGCYLNSPTNFFKKSFSIFLLGVL